MLKNKKDDDSEELEVTTKTITFNPTGFIVNIIFSIGMAIFLGNPVLKTDEHNIFYVIFGYLTFFAMFWCLGKVFGFCLRVTRNYIIAFIAWIAVTFGICLGIDKLFGDNSFLIFLLILIVVPILDFRKAIKFYRS